MTSRRPIAIALAASAFYAGVFVTAAQAEMHYVRVTLVTGQQLTITVEIPPGTPVEQVQIPGLPAAVASIVDLGSTETTPTPTATIAPTVTATPSPTALRRRRPRTRRAARRRTRARTRPRSQDKPKTEEKVEEPTTTTGGGDANTESLTGKVEKAKPDPTPEADDDQADQQADAPAANDPSVTLSEPGAAKIGVPNFFIDKFRIPPFLLPIYQAAGTQYGVRWELLAAINEIETDYGRNLNVSSAGAQGWMQFMPASWEAYGVDGNSDGLMDPYNPVDAIFAAARYLKAAGADTDIRKAIFAYNHADWYVDSVLLRAQVIGGLPSNLVGSLTGLTEGRFPVAAKASYANQVTRRGLKAKGSNRAIPLGGTNRRGLSIFADAGSPVIAVSDVQVVKVGVSKRLGNFIQVQDAYGNTYTYGRLAKISKLYAAPKPQKVDPAEVKRMLAEPPADKAPKAAASDTDRPASRAANKKLVERETPEAVEEPVLGEPPVKERLFANPTRLNAAAAGGAQQEFLRTGRIDGALTPARALGLARDQIVIKKLKVGSQVPAGTVLGRIGRASSVTKPHVRFEIRPAGRGAPRIDPKPILDGWKLLESTAIYRAKGKNPFVGPDAATPTIGQILLMSKETLTQRVLADPRVQIYGCGRNDIKARRDRPPRAGHARVPGRLRLQPDGHVAHLRALVLVGLRQRLRALDRHRGRHRRGQRHPDPRQPGQGLDHRARHPAPDHAPGHDEAAPDHLADEVRGHGQHAVHGRSRRSHPRRLQAAVRLELEAVQAAQRRPEAGAVDPPDRAPRRDRQPEGVDRPVHRGAQGQAFAQGPVTEDRRFRFVQWEFAGRLGPPPGRYVVRRYAGDDVREVVVVTEASAPRRLARREPPGAVAVTRVTVIDASRARHPRTGSSAPRRRSRTSSAPTASPPPTPTRPIRTGPWSCARGPAPARGSPRASGTTRASFPRPNRRSRRAAPSTGRPSASPR